MPRCNSCNKFVSLDSDNEASVNVEVDPETGEIEGSADIENNCAECGDTVRTGSVDLELSAASHEALTKFTDALGEGWTFEAEDESFERATKTEGKGRGCRTFYGVEGEVTIKASRADGEDLTAEQQEKITAGEIELEITLNVSGFVQASGMDEA